MLHLPGPVPEASSRLKKLRRKKSLRRAHHRDITGRKHGHKYSKKYQYAENNTAGNRSLILTESPERVFKEGSGLCIKFFIRDPFILLNQDKVIVPENNFSLFCISHYFFAPILILGSIKP